jgi:hypothetical protein
MMRHMTVPLVSQNTPQINTGGTSHRANKRRYQPPRLGLNATIRYWSEPTPGQALGKSFTHESTRRYRRTKWALKFRARIISAVPPGCPKHHPTRLSRQHEFRPQTPHSISVPAF